MHFSISEEKRKKILHIALGAAAALLLLLGILALCLGGQVTEEPVTERPVFSVPENELLVEDIYDGEVLIPKFNLARNTYDPQKFVQEDGFLTYKSTRSMLGVDVSEYQGAIDWNTVKSSGVDFAIIRLGYRGSTKGYLNEDSRFEQNLESAMAAGLSVGVYFFSQAISEAEAVAEADFVLEKLRGRKLSFPVVFDWEPPVPTSELPASELRAYGAKGADVTEYAAAFCERIRKAGYSPCVYTNKSMAYHFFDLDQLKSYDLWYAEYQTMPSMYYYFRLWQYTDAGYVPGIDGNVDVNICFFPY